jgi:hypothetical protein
VKHILVVLQVGKSSTFVKDGVTIKHLPIKNETSKDGDIPPLLINYLKVFCSP